MTDTRTLPIPDPVQPFTLHLEKGGSGLWFGTSPEIRGILVAVTELEHAEAEALKQAALLRKSKTQMDRIVSAMAAAMQAKRRELIARPLADIWPELAKAAFLASWFFEKSETEEPQP